MTDAPERIWANGLGCYGDSDAGGTEYVRADLYELVGRERDDAKQALRNEIVAHGNTIRGKAERLAGARVKPLRELIASYSTRFTDEKVDYQRGILDTLDNIEMVLDGTHDEGPPLAEPAGEAEHIETYYTKGKDAEYFEKLTDKDFAWEITKAAQDLNDSGDNVADWMPVSAMLSDAADRLNKHLATPPASAIREALPVTGPYVDRLIRIFRDRPDDDGSAMVLQDYARAALAGAKP